MRTTIRFDHSVVVAVPVADVFAYTADFARAHEWRAEVVESTMSTPRMAAGTTLREVAVIARRKVVTLSRVAAFEPGHRFTFEHVQGMLPVSGEYRVEPHPAGAKLTFDANLIGELVQLVEEQIEQIRAQLPAAAA